MSKRQGLPDATAATVPATSIIQGTQDAEPDPEVAATQGGALAGVVGANNADENAGGGAIKKLKA